VARRHDERDLLFFTTTTTLRFFHYLYVFRQGNWEERVVLLHNALLYYAKPNEPPR
jgi:hypothetical protein